MRADTGRTLPKPHDRSSVPKKPPPDTVNNEPPELGPLSG